MLELSRALNPECRHLQGDMRSLRLEERFEAVLIFDAICVFRGNPATDSTASRPPIPGQSGHGFHVKPATFSRDSGHPFQGKPATCLTSIILAGRRQLLWPVGDG
jgi:hypothetical protein